LHSSFAWALGVLDMNIENVNKKREPTNKAFSFLVNFLGQDNMGILYIVFRCDRIFV